MNKYLQKSVRIMDFFIYATLPIVTIREALNEDKLTIAYVLIMLLWSRTVIFRNEKMQKDKAQ